MQPPKRVHPGQPSISATEWNRWTQEVYRLSKLTAEAPLEITQGAYPQIRLINPIINARITDEGWEEVLPDGDGTWTAPDNARAGTADQNPAYELNGNSAPAGTIVKLYPGYNGEYLYWFSSGSFLAQLVQKTYVTNNHIAYSWIRVLDTTTPYPVTYTGEDQYGIPGDMPAYHEQNIDLPVWPALNLGPNDPGAANNNNSSGNVAWSNPNNIASSDDSYATCELPDTQESQYLVGTDYGFSIPSTAVILAIGVEIENKSTTAADVTAVEIKLVKGGNITGNNLATSSPVPTSDTYFSFSGSTRQWGVDLTPADVNGTGFGACVRYRNESGSTQTVSVDHIRITILYSDGVARHSVVRLRKGAGDYYLIDQLPWEDLFRRTSNSDADGAIGYLRYFDQNDNTWKDGEEVRIVLVE